MYRLFGARSEPALDQSLDVDHSEDLRPQVVRIFALVGEAIAGATHALLAGDRELAKRIVDQDVVIDELVNSVVTTPAVARPFWGYWLVGTFLTRPLSVATRRLTSPSC